MSRNRTIAIICSALFISIAILGYVFIINPKLKEDKEAKIFKTFLSLMEPSKVHEMNIILFTVDTLRADHLECYGYDLVKTPHINRLAREGTLFDYNIVQAPLTLPSHSSILTGMNPLYHGVRDNGGFYLEESHITLAEVLKSRGYSTAAFVAAFVLDSRWGIDQGFDFYYDNFDLTKYKKASLDSVQRRGDEVISEAYKWLENHSQEKFFAWIHLYDPHTPYDPPEPYKAKYKGRPFGLYDGEIAYVDQLMGEFRSFMEEKNLMDKTLIIFTSDHGESLGEHKESAHGFFIYDSDIRVPLIIRFSENTLAGRRIASQVRSIDIMPTILNLIGERIPENVQGESLLPLLIGKKQDEYLPAYSETYWPNFHYGWSDLKSIRKERYKFIDAPRPELYDILDDPGEIHNLIDKKASLGHELKRELDALIARYSKEGIEEKGPKKIDNDSLIKLQALGYIGSFYTPAKRKGEKLSDPKDKIELYNEIKVAQFLVTEEKMEQAEKKIKDVLSKDASVLEARYILGNIYSKQKKYDQAIEEYKKALEVNPEYYETIFALALAYKDAKRYDEAIPGFKRLIDLDPRDTKPLLHLGDIYEERGELDEAMRHLKSAVAIDPEAPVFHNKLGAVYLKREMYEEAEIEIRKALSIERSVPLLNAHFNMALLREARGEIDLAILEYKKEQETSPFNYKPDFNLGLLYAKSKELDNAIEEFRSCIEKNEEYAPAYVFYAKAYMDGKKDLNEAEEWALRGISLNPDRETAILAHYVLADIYNRMGRHRESQRHVDRARQLRKSISD